MDGTALRWAHAMPGTARMSSWVRYGVAVYVGLLMAGAFGDQRPGRAPGSSWDDSSMVTGPVIAGDEAVADAGPAGRITYDRRTKNH